MNPSLIAKNQFGEQSNLVLLGGSSQVGCNFIVDSANGNGLGLRSLKGQGVKNVYMHTSASPAAGNPNPLAGYIAVEFDKSYAGYVNGFDGFVSPLSGSSLNVDASDAALTVHQLYAITALGTSTAADWLALGVPVGVTPAVGVCFIALVTGSGTGSGTVQAPAATGSGVLKVEVCGNPQTTVIGAVNGWMFLQVLGATSAGSTVLKPTAPADGSVIGLAFTMIPQPGSPL